jgi:hypothetical protein
MAVFKLKQGGVVATEIYGLPSLKYLLSWPLQTKS